MNERNVSLGSVLLALLVVMFGVVSVQAQSALTCSIDSIHITADNFEQRYNPMPFALTVHILNAGETVTDSVFATIIVPPDLELHDPDAPDRYTIAVPRQYMFPGDTASVSWMLRHPITLQVKDYTVRVLLQPKHGDTTWCETQVVIPALDAPSLRASCIVPDRIEFSEEQESYVPNPFELKLNVINLGKMTADSVTGFLYLPDGVELDPPGQPLRVDFGSLENWSTGDSIPTHTWTVRWPQRLRYNKTLRFMWAVGGVGRSGVPTDTVYTSCATDVPGITPKLIANCGGVGGYVCKSSDSLRWNSELGEYEPNPYWVRFRLTNVGYIEYGIKSMTCYYHNDGVGLDTSKTGNTQTRDLDITLQPGDSVVQYWWFNAQPRSKDRIVRTQIIAIDEDGNPWSHIRNIHIPGVNSCLGYRDHNSTHVVDYDSTLQWYTDRRITLSHGLYNCGEWTYNNPWIELTVDDPEGYLAYDTAYANPQRATADKLRPGDTLYGTWHLRLAKPNVTDQQVVIPYEFRFGVDGAPAGEPDAHYLIIEPAMVTAIDEPESPGTLTLSQNYPNPFNPSTEITYSVPRAMHVSLRVFDALGREAAVLVDEWQVTGTYRVPFDASDSPAGVYVYRLETAQGVLSRKMVVVK